MTLGVNIFDMAVHLSSSTHSASVVVPSHHHHHLHDRDQAPTGLHHHHHSHHHHGYPGYDQSIKYEAMDHPDNSPPATTTPTSTGGTIAAATVAADFSQSQQQQQISSSSPLFGRDHFYDSDTLGMVLSQDSHHHPHHLHHRGLSSSTPGESSSDDAQASPLGGGGSNVGSSMVSASSSDGRQLSRVLSKSNNADRKRPYPCKVCPSKFGSKMELEEHQNSHTGMKPFECEICKSRFNRRSTLWNHKRIHSDAKPFVCTVCHMQFKWKNSLKCHKEMHVRKNETTVAVDNEIRQLTYATAAKRRMLENDGSDGGSSFSSGAASTSQAPGSNDSSSKNGVISGTKKRPRLSKKESNGTIDDDHLERQHQPQACPPSDSQQSLIENLNQRFHDHHSDALSSLQSNLGMDLHLDQSNIDLMNNQILQAFWPDGMDQSLNSIDFRSNQQNLPVFGGMDDTSKMLSGSIFDIKDTLALQSPNSNASNPLMALSFKPMLNLDLNHLNPLQDPFGQRSHPALPTINNFTSATLNDYSNHEALHSNFQLAHTRCPTTTSASSSLSTHGHLNPDLQYQQSLDHALLLNTNHQNDYMGSFDYMTPSGASSSLSTTYPTHSDLPLSALTSNHDSLDHSPHQARPMFYNPSLMEHHPGCLSSQLPTAQQMR